MEDANCVITEGVSQVCIFDGDVCKGGAYVNIQACPQFTQSQAENHWHTFPLDRQTAGQGFMG